MSFLICAVGTAATTGPLYQPQMIGDGDCADISGMKIGKGNQSTRRKPTPAPLCISQIPHDLESGLNPGRRGGKPATNRLLYGAALRRTDTVGLFHIHFTV
jgi:hypothetical protein